MQTQTGERNSAAGAFWRGTLLREGEQWEESSSECGQRIPVNDRLSPEQGQAHKPH